MRWFSVFALALAIGCGGGDSDKGNNNNGDDDDDDDSSGALVFEDFIFTGDEIKADDLGGWSNTETDWSKVSWNEDSPITPDPLEATANLDVLDFESDDAVPDATVEVWFGDEVSGSPDVNTTSDENGKATLDGIPACQPMAYRVTTDPILDETKTTLKAHHIFAATDPRVDEFLSVSRVTYQLIPSLLGISPDADKGIIAGTAFDINEEPIENAQVIVYDEDGNIPQSLLVKYFVDNFPNRDQQATSADGLWVAINVPKGDNRAELWGVVDGEMTLLGATIVKGFADSINISNIMVGYGDGVFYPPECL